MNILAIDRHEMQFGNWEPCEAVRSTAPLRAQIAADTAEFLARGGVIQKIPEGMSGHNFQLIKGRYDKPQWANARQFQNIRIRKAARA